MRAKRITKKCLNCGNDFSIPPCRDWREHCCSSACKKAWRNSENDKNKNNRKRVCEACNKEFYPRGYQLKTGQGRFCSEKCFRPNLTKMAHTEEANKKRGESRKVSILEGRFVVPKGEKHHQWTGGPLVARRRRIESGKANIYVRAYRKANPHKIREWSQNRKTRKTGRLPRGTLTELFALQKGRCAICTTKLDDSYHTDHIVPLARGGKHERCNIQLLCRTCNVRKSAKDPIKFAQEMGRLL